MRYIYWLRWKTEISSEQPFRISFLTVTLFFRSHFLGFFFWIVKHFSLLYTHICIFYECSVGGLECATVVINVNLSKWNNENDFILCSFSYRLRMMISEVKLCYHWVATRTVWLWSILINQHNFVFVKFIIIRFFFGKITL